MREYKFRGKRLDNGEWVYGCLVKCANAAFIVDLSDLVLLNTETLHGLTKQWAVDPATVGQYTEEQDRNDVPKDIYEGDILEDSITGQRVEVYFDYGSFCVVDINEIEKPGIEFAAWFDDKSYVYVVDTIHDKEAEG